MYIIQGSFNALESDYKKFWLTREPYFGKPVSQESYNYKHAGIRKKYRSLRIFLAEEEAVVIGRVLACVEHNGDGFVKGLYVDKDHRNQGIGTALMLEVDKWLTETMKCANIYLNVVKDNEGALIFYDKLGYEINIYVMKK